MGASSYAAKKSVNNALTKEEAARANAALQQSEYERRQAEAKYEKDKEKWEKERAVAEAEKKVKEEKEREREREERDRAYREQVNREFEERYRVAASAEAMRTGGGPPAYESRAGEVSAIFCSKCGKQCTADANFCGRCGNKIA